MDSTNTDSQTDADANSASGDNKKRSKLGYHRSSIACGHCRRRKIRCLPSSDGPGAMCQNCVRLKKDCQFLPVDQQGLPPPKKSHSSSKPGMSIMDTMAIPNSLPPESSIDGLASFASSSASLANTSADWGHPTSSAMSRQHINPGYGTGQPYWQSPIAAAPDQYVRQNSYHGPVAGPYYMPINATPAIAFGQQQYFPISPTASVPSESRPIYDEAMQDVRNMSNFQDAAMVQYPGQYLGPERSTTMPTLLAGQQNADASAQYSPQFGSELRQFPHAPRVPPQHVHYAQHARASLYDQTTQEQHGASGATYPTNEEQLQHRGRPP